MPSMVGIFSKVKKLRYILETQAEGYLKCTKRIGSRRRFYRLSGAVLYEYRSHEFNITQEEPKELTVIGFHSSDGIRKEISVKCAKKKKPLMLTAATPQDYSLWKNALTAAAERDITMKYRFEKELGSGCYGVVYLAEHIDTCEKVAIKKIRKSAQARYLEREVNLAKTINHPAIIRTYDVYETAEFLFLVLEYMCDGELYNHLESQGSFSERDASDIVRTILQGLAYLHRNGIVHRDLKPENILCCKGPDGKLEVKLADFGLAGLIVATNALPEDDEDDIITYSSLVSQKHIDNYAASSPKSITAKKSLMSDAFHSFRRQKEYDASPGAQDTGASPSSSALSRPPLGGRDRSKKPQPRVLHDYDLYAAAEQKLLGNEQTMTSFVGSPAFAAPELLRCLRYGPAVDSWGVGVILFNMLSGELPFYANTAKETMAHVIEGKFFMKERDWHGISHEARSLVKSLLQSDPHKRLTIEAALHHPFLDQTSGRISSTPIRPHSEEILFNPRRKAVKNTVRSVRMASRLMALALSVSSSSNGDYSERNSSCASSMDQELLEKIQRELSARSLRN